MRTILLILTILLISNCNMSTDPVPEPEVTYFPLWEGNWWSIKQENNIFEPLESFIDTCKIDTTFIAPLTVYDVGQWGHLAWEDGALYEVYSYQGRRMLIPKNKEIGTRFNESETEYWGIGEIYEESITVEAGTFKDFILIYRFRFVDGGWYNEREDVYAKGVGRILTYIHNGWLPPGEGLHQELSNYNVNN